jgi:hypothetical protein
MPEIDLRLFHYANGRADHYCIGRATVSCGMPCSEFWNAERGDFASAGTVYAGMAAALLAMGEIGDVLRSRQSLTERK